MLLEFSEAIPLIVSNTWFRKIEMPKLRMNRVFAIV